MERGPNDEEDAGAVIGWDGAPLSPHPTPPAPTGEEARPIRLVVLDPDLKRNRWTVVVRIILAIPLLIWSSLWSIATGVVAVITWFIVLVTARCPEGLQDYNRAYIRFHAHLFAYLSFAADRYPSFVGREGYAVDVEIDPTPRLSRWRAAIRIVLAVPALALSSTFAGSPPLSGSSIGGTYFQVGPQMGTATALVGFLGWFVCLARGRMTAGMRDLAAYAIGYGAQVSGYLLFLTDRYPNAHPECVLPPLRVPRHPVRVENRDDLRRSRLLVLLRLPLCFPHIFWLTLWSLIVTAILPLVWLVVLVLGRLPLFLHRFLSAFIRASAQFTAFATLVAGPFPGFVGTPGYPVDVLTDGPAPQHRLVTLLRILLSFPAQVIAGLVYGFALLVVAVLSWFTGLFLGRVPPGLQAIGAAAVRYNAQTYAYLYLVTDRYPYASPGLEEDAGPEPVPVELELWAPAAASA